MRKKNNITANTNPHEIQSHALSLARTYTDCFIEAITLADAAMALGKVREAKIHLAAASRHHSSMYSEMCRLRISIAAIKERSRI